MYLMTQNLENMDSIDLQVTVMHLEALVSFRDTEGLTEVNEVETEQIQNRLDDARSVLGKRMKDALAAREARLNQRVDSLKTTAERRADARSELLKLNKLKAKLS